jgi:hypothetical protein
VPSVTRAAVLILMLLPASAVRAQDPPPGEKIQILRLNGQEYEVTRENPKADADGDVPMYRLSLEDEPVLQVCGRGGKLTHVTDGDSTTIAMLAADLRENRRAVPLQELLWEALLSSEWERRGDLLAKQARKGDVPREALVAYERAVHPFFVSPRLYEKLAGPYLQLLKDPLTPRTTLSAVAAAVARWPEPTEPAARGSQVALARGCSFFFLRCYPRAAEALAQAGVGADGEGLREVLKVLGADRWSAAERSAGLTRWTCEAKPGGDGLPAYESAFSLDGRMYYLTRRSLGAAEGYYLHAVGGADETLVEAYGGAKPSFKEVETRIRAQRLAGPETSGCGLIPAPRALPPLAQGEPGRVEVRWEGDLRSERVEIRRDALEAAVWLRSGTGSPVLIKGLAPGRYVAFLRDAQGRVLQEREIVIAPGEKSVIDVDRF